MGHLVPDSGMGVGEEAQALTDVAEAVRTGDCILFLGAGVHAPPPQGSTWVYPQERKPPTAKELSEVLASECDFCGVVAEPPTDLQRVSLCYEANKAGGRQQLINRLDDLLRRNREPSPALGMLAALPFKIFITTNYDLLLERAMALLKSRKDPVVLVYNPDEHQPTRDMTSDPTSDRPLVFKIHGDLQNRESIVITDEDYIKFVQRMGDKDEVHPVPNTIRFRVAKWPTLFVGYSLRDYNLRLLFRTLRWKLDPSNMPPSFAVDMKPDPLIRKVYHSDKPLVTFLAEDLWTFVPRLYQQVQGEPWPSFCRE